MPLVPGLPVCFFSSERDPHNVDPNKEGNYLFVEGWEKIRPRRDAGGGHGLTERKVMNQWACAMCMAKRGQGIHVDQGSMF